MQNVVFVYEGNI